MDLSVIAFIALLLVVAALRIIELRVSRNHQRAMMPRGATIVAEPLYPWLVAVHTLVLIGAAVEVIALKRPFIPALAATMFAIFLAANLVRLWVIRTLGNHWNVQVMDSASLGVITTGPFRFVRHPNYAAVIVELITLPLIHTAWITSIVGTLGYLSVLMQRIPLEERALFANPDYRAAMSAKPRFLPGLF
jgi:methyltransferase